MRVSRRLKEPSQKGKNGSLDFGGTEDVWRKGFHRGAMEAKSVFDKVLVNMFPSQIRQSPEEAWRVISCLLGTTKV